MALDRVTGVLGDHIMTRNSNGTYDTDRDLYVDEDTGHLLALTNEQAGDPKYTHNPAAAEKRD